MLGMGTGGGREWRDGSWGGGSRKGMKEVVDLG